jgi:signal transduction histidine kinase
VRPVLLEDKEAATGFAEIELLAGGKNVALGRVPQVADLKTTGMRQPSSMTDGRNIRGAILPLQQWMDQLARRHELEKTRPLLAAELQGLYEAQKTKLRYLSWVIAILVGAVVIIILIDRLLRLRQAARLKERFAADLHDELGANLHTIVLLGDIAANKSNALPGNIAGLIQRMQATAKRSVFAVEHVTDLQSAGRICKNLPVDMRRAAERIVVELKHDFNVQGEDHLARVHPRDQVNLFLFYKECLINSCRHSGATELITRLVIKARSLELSVTDNGSGHNAEDAEGAEEDAQHGGDEEVPSSLQRRAKILGAHVTRTRPPGGGSCITLSMRTWNHWMRRS